MREKAIRMSLEMMKKIAIQGLVLTTGVLILIVHNALGRCMQLVM
jgi:hypothetical protein